MILVSSCLLGVRSRYDGGQKASLGLLKDLLKDGVIPICPEQLGGLPTPRPPAEIVGGDGLDVLRGTALVVDSQGTDVTRAFLQGAEEALKIARLIGADMAILKSRSPSCGLGPVVGVTAALFLLNGIHLKEIG